MDDATQNRSTGDLVELTADIVSAYVANNPVDHAGLAELIASVHGSLVNLGKSQLEAERMSAPLEPAVPVRKSVTPDYIVCLEDGKKFKSLRRHLRSAYDMTPEQYRARWGLPLDYPMVAPNYAAARSAMAKTMRLGQKRAFGRMADAPTDLDAESVPRQRGGARKQAG